jgi:hypothetical protein
MSAQILPLKFAIVAWSIIKKTSACEFEMATRQ